MAGSYEDGAPAQPFFRYLPADGTMTRPNGCGPDGTFFLCGLPLGWVRWRIEVPGERIRASELTSADLDVGTIVLSRPQLLEGRVFLHDAPPDVSYESLRLALFRDGGMLDDVALEKDGRFSRAIPTGEARLQILRPEGVLVDQTIQVPRDPLEIALDPHVGESSCAT
jgi:hypothetical protein